MDFSFTEEQSMLRDIGAATWRDHYDFDKRREALAKERGRAGAREIWKAVRRSSASSRAASRRISAASAAAPLESTS